MKAKKRGSHLWIRQIEGCVVLVNPTDDRPLIKLSLLNLMQQSVPSI